jgi:hypothetical protein
MGALPIACLARTKSRDILERSILAGLAWIVKLKCRDAGKCVRVRILAPSRDRPQR